MELKRIAVVGCGRMGRGIALLAAQHGVQVVAVPGRVGVEGQERSAKRFAADKARLVKRRGAEAGAAFDRITVVAQLEEVTDCPIWIESILEERQAKLTLLAAIEAHVSADTLLATNTSSLPLADLAAGLSHPERFLALHFFNPPTKMKLVEVAPTTQTSSRFIERATLFCEQIGQRPIAVKDSSGYVVNRLLVPLLLHAMQTLEMGVADVDAIDTALLLGLSHPMGPLGLADYIGLDVVLAMATTMRTQLDDPRFEVPSILRRLVDAGQLGRKSKLGFYDYRGSERVVSGELNLHLA